MSDLLTRHRLRNDDPHPLERYALLARIGEVAVEPYRVVRGRPIRETVRATGDREHPIWDYAIQVGLGHAWGGAGFRLNGSRYTTGSVRSWPDNTEWHLLPNGETHGLRRIGNTFSHDGNYDPAVTDYLASLYDVVPVEDPELRASVWTHRWGY